MIRKFNYTGRKRLLRKSVSVNIVADETGRSRTFNARLEFDGVDLAQEARVYIEAYRASAYKRFPWGTVGNPVPPLNRSLDDLNANVDLRFRVKVVDEERGAGRLLAVADNLKPTAPGADGKDRQPLLSLETVDLGERIWRLSFEDFPASPVVLQVNSRVTEIEHFAKRDQVFRALVFPAALEQILTFAILVEEFDTEEPEPEVQHWLRYVATFHATPVPEDKLERSRWVSDAVNAFCTKFRVRHDFEQARLEE